MAVTRAAAVNRFGLGARPGDLDGSGDPRDWLRKQWRGAPDLSAFANLPDSGDTLVRELALLRERRQARRQQPMPADEQPARKPMPADTADGLRALRRQQLDEFGARFRHAARTDAPFHERLVQFWSNHFAVSIDKGTARLYAAPMEREAIRPRVTGRFVDLLLAVETHPAMLRYLDNAVSIGDGSPAAQRMGRRSDGPRRGLNENLAREILELHTLGVDGGYGQADVTELARAITGWSTRGAVARRGDAAAPPGASSAFVFRGLAHEPGARTVLGKRYADDGYAQGRAILDDLARHPATARHLATKLARHFVADRPPQALVERMARAYLAADGRLDALYAALVDGNEAWDDDARKLKTPQDFVVSALRASGATVSTPQATRELVDLLARLGQPLFTPRSPAGFPDTAADWGGGDALFKRVQAAQGFAARVSSDATPDALARAVLGDGAVQGDFAATLRRTGSPREGYALLFASPAFQWRT